ncbi:NAD(P)H-dependent glutamate synthase, partial [Reticulomyxa filosa]
MSKELVDRNKNQYIDLSLFKKSKHWRNVDIVETLDWIKFQKELGVDKTAEEANLTPLKPPPITVKSMMGTGEYERTPVINAGTYTAMMEGNVSTVSNVGNVNNMNNMSNVNNMSNMSNMNNMNSMNNMNNMNVNNGMGSHVPIRGNDANNYSKESWYRKFHGVGRNLELNLETKLTSDLKQSLDSEVSVINNFFFFLKCI